MASRRTLLASIPALLAAFAPAQEGSRIRPLALYPAAPSSAAQRRSERIPNFDIPNSDILNFDIQARFGGGNFEHETEGSTFDGDTSAGYFALQLEGFSDAGFGGGLRLEGIGTDDDLFAEAGFPDSEATSGELFLYFGYRASFEDLSMPLRAGLTFIEYTLEDAASEEIRYSSAAFRFEVEPEVDLVKAGAARWSLYANGGLGIGETGIDTDPATFEADSDAFLFNFDLGTRVELGPVLLGLGYVIRRTSTDDSDLVGGSFFRGIDTTFTGVQFTLGARF